MKTVLREVCELRKENIFELDNKNSNRYSIVVNESDGKTAYCFSTPIYNTETKKLVYRAFEKHGEAFVFKGSNTLVTVHKNMLILKNAEGNIIIDLPNAAFDLDNGVLRSETCELTPSLNGCMICIKKKEHQIKLRLDNPFLEVRHNTKCFALMEDTFKPFVTISAIPSHNNCGKCVPSRIDYSIENVRTYNLLLSSKEGNEIYFEVNLYERKLFQDTTVDSAVPNENNAFGSVAYLGNTSWFGEQWLYTRLDMTKLDYFEQDNIEHILLHIPCLFNNKKRVFAYLPLSRFCSFGSTWENKKDISEAFAFSKNNGKYTTIDLTEIFKNDTHNFLQNGLAIKCNYIKNSYTVLATADNYTYPTILEIKYKE